MKGGEKEKITCWDFLGAWQVIFFAYFPQNGTGIRTI